MSWKERGTLLGKWVLNPKCNFYKSSCLVKWTKDLFKNHVDFFAAVYKFTGKDFSSPEQLLLLYQPPSQWKAFLYIHTYHVDAFNNQGPTLTASEMPQYQVQETFQLKNENPSCVLCVFPIKECHVF